VARKSVSSAAGRISAAVGRVGAAIPAGIPSILRRSWSFTVDMARKFGKQLNNPEKRENEFLKTVRKDFERWA